MSCCWTPERRRRCRRNRSTAPRQPVILRHRDLRAPLVRLEHEYRIMWRTVGHVERGRLIARARHPDTVAQCAAEMRHPHAPAPGAATRCRQEAALRSSRAAHSVGGVAANIIPVTWRPQRNHPTPAASTTSMTVATVSRSSTRPIGPGTTDEPRDGHGRWQESEGIGRWAIGPWSNWPCTVECSMLVTNHRRARTAGWARVSARTAQSMGQGSGAPG